MNKWMWIGLTMMIVGILAIVSHDVFMALQILFVTLFTFLRIILVGIICLFSSLFGSGRCI